MTPKELLERIEDLSNYNGDHEAYHSREDDLMLEILEVIANGSDDAKKLCQLMLEAHENYDGERWYGQL